MSYFSFGANFGQNFGPRIQERNFVKKALILLKFVSSPPNDISYSKIFVENIWMLGNER